MRIAVTGMGCVTPCGNDVSTFWDTVVSGRSGIRRITRFETEGFDVDIAGELKEFDPTKNTQLNRKEARRAAPYVLYALAAAHEAVLQSQLLEAVGDPERVGCIVGTGIGALTTIEHETAVLNSRGPRRVNPLLVPSGTPEVAPSEIVRRYGFKGPSFGVSTACSSGTDAIISAARCIASGDADVVIAGGTESTVSRLAVATFSNLGALARSNGDPTRVSRPFDRDRSGFVMGEGAGILVLETLEHAQSRQAPILAVFCGYGQTTDAFHKTAPDPSGREATRAIRLAMRQAQVEPQDIAYVNAHGTSTQQNDPVETLVIKQALGDHAYKVPVSSTKSMTGHMIGAAGAVEAVAAVKAIETGCIPPTINHDEPDPECDLFYVPNEAIEAPVEVALSNSFAFGGHNSSLLFRAFRGPDRTDRFGSSA